MMEIPAVVWVGVAFVLAAIGGLWAWLFARGRRADFTSRPAPGERPPWQATTPPPETVAATQADGEDGALWDYDAGEEVAAPFAEQIEDIVRARVAAEPGLAGTDFDLGTADDGSLEFWLNGQLYASVAELPDERIRQVVQEAIAYWENWHARVEE